MGFFDELGKALTPHTEKLGDTLKFHLIAIHDKLERIERATSDLGRGDIGDKWQRFQVKKKFASGEDVEIGTCPVNEMWLIQAITSDGVQEKSPPYAVLANGILIQPVLKEGIGQEGIGGDQVVLPGERLSVTAREEGNISCVITIIRRMLPGNKIPVDYGEGTERHSPRAIHDPARDELVQRIPALYGAREGQQVESEGRTEQNTGMTVRS